MTANRKLIKVQIDKLIYSVQADPMAKSSSLYQLFRRLPLLTNRDGNFLIKGRISPTLLINGVPSTALNSNPKEVLQSIPAGTIKEIQIIANPGVQYDGEFSGGIINIVTKQTFEMPMTGSISLTGSSRRSYSTEASLALQLNKVTLQATYTHSGQDKYKEIWTNDRTFLNDKHSHRLLQDKERIYDKNNYDMLMVASSWTPNDKNLLNITINYFKLHTHGSGLQANTLYNVNKEKTSAFDIMETSDTKYNNIDISANYQRKLGTSGTLLLMYKFTDMPKDVDDHFIVSKKENYNRHSQRIWKSTHNIEHTLQCDYSQKIMDPHTLNTGMKYIVRLNSNDSKLYTQEQKESGWQYNNDASDLFAHKQSIIAAYGEYSYAINSWKVTAGLRNELTLERIYYDLMPNKNFSTHFNDLLGALTISYTLPQENILNLYYRSHISRPSIHYLNPKGTVQDPTYVYFGNPDIRAERHHKAGIEYTLNSSKVFLTLSTDYSMCDNSIEADYHLHQDGILYRTFANSGGYHSINTAAYISYMPNAILSLSFNGNLNYTYIKGNLGGLKTSNKGYTGGLYSDFNINLPMAYYLTLYGAYNFPTIMLSGTGFNFYNCGASLTKSFFDDRLNLSASVTDFLWDTKKYKRELRTKDLTILSGYQNYGIIAELSVRFMFNNKKINPKKTSKKITNNDVIQFQ
ncbi:outer membrane beta-barrel protein [Porphyromonas sp.]|uniref:outer membrane beta-barrel protein n=1 Tax=Porphyromonas sp. TaxID=1924944 RepID=UPI0026DAB71D|nr:outer membrane beta-barrel protein [Porphyromonas sp.]MDO4695543.1 outer membrane beta-barrel protein [Porphyromonas sp.]MDO4771350.1 outer membrane beta-barrel protein [Porphyromonas sp.]